MVMRLVAMSRAGKCSWPATRVALVYMLVQCLMMWILPLFPAQPIPSTEERDRAQPLTDGPESLVRWLHSRSFDRSSRDPKHQDIPLVPGPDVSAHIKIGTRQVWSGVE